MSWQYHVVIVHYNTLQDRNVEETHKAKNTEDLQYIMTQFVYLDDSIRKVTITRFYGEKQ